MSGERGAKRLQITHELLESMGACFGALERFDDRFPKGLVITDDQEENFEIFAPWVLALSIRNGDAISYPEPGANLNRDLDWIIGEIAPPLFWHTNPWHDDLFQMCGVLADAVGVYLKANPDKAYRGR